MTNQAPRKCGDDYRHPRTIESIEIIGTIESIQYYGSRCSTTLRTTLPAAVFNCTVYTPLLSHEPVSERPFQLSAFCPATAEMGLRTTSRPCASLMVSVSQTIDEFTTGNSPKRKLKKTFIIASVLIYFVTLLLMKKAKETRPKWHYCLFRNAAANTKRRNVSRT
jgi:hypothetical protein